MKIVALIPCYNEARTIGDVVSEAKKCVDKVVVVDDGSCDGTSQAAKRSGAFVIRHDYNKGYGEAVRSGLGLVEWEKNDIVVMLDGDGQHNPKDIPKVLNPVLEGTVDLVVGSRFMENGTKMPRYRGFGIRVITFLYNFGSKVKLSDSQCGFKACKMSVLNACPINESGLGASVELLIKARSKGFVLREVPVSCFYPKSGAKRNPVRHGLAVALDVIRIRMKNWRYK